MSDLETLFSTEYWNGIDVTSPNAMEQSSPYHIDLGSNLRDQSRETVKTLKKCGDLLGIVPVYGILLEADEFTERRLSPTDDTVIDLAFSSVGSLFALRLESLTYMQGVDTKPGKIKGETPLHPSTSLVDIWKNNDQAPSATSIDGENSQFYNTSLHWGLLAPRANSGSTNDALLTIPFSLMPKYFKRVKDKLEELSSQEGSEHLKDMDEIQCAFFAIRAYGAVFSNELVKEYSANANRIVLPTTLENVQVEESRSHRTLRRVSDARSVEIKNFSFIGGGPPEKRRNRLKEKSTAKVTSLLPGLIPNPSAT